MSLCCPPLHTVSLTLSVWLVFLQLLADSSSSLAFKHTGEMHSPLKLNVHVGFALANEI